MPADLNHDAFARERGAPEEPRRRRYNSPPGWPNEREGFNHQALIGLGVLIAALVALLWSGSLLALTLVSFTVALALLAGLLFILWRRPR